jgi:hypothetical protein
VAVPYDGIGDVWIDVGPNCPYTDTFTSAQSFTVEDVDWNDPDLVVEYEATGIAAGTHQVWSWFDDNGDTIPSSPFPSGDPAHFSCVEVTVSDTEGAVADMVLDTII